VFVDRDARGKGLSKRLVAHIVDEADEMGVRRVLLATGDAQGLYQRFGFVEIADDYSWMYKVWPDRP
jgi:N-acetylglutamate synthase-like GNAT family acetyltransferase